jgi:protoporphyrinogen oxidase
MKIAILGSGISGLSIGQILNTDHEVAIYEIKDKIGGLIKCERVNDCLFHKVGGHVFNSKNKEVLNWFWSFFDKEKEFTSATRNAKIFYDEKIIGYPIENYLYKLDKHLVKKIISELQRASPKEPFEYENFESFLKGSFGDTLFEIYFGPYNKKIWQTDLSKVAIPWLEGKMPMPNFTEIMYSNFIREENNDMVHSCFFYPKNEGSQFIVNRLSEGLNISTNKNSQQITLSGDKLSLNNENFDKLIYTGDIRIIPEKIKTLLIDNGIDWKEVSALTSNGTSNLFCETDDTAISWLYIPQNFTKAHRIIYTGNFSETNNRGSKRKTCVVEFSGCVEYEIMVKEIKKLPGNLTPLACNYEPNSYVIQDFSTRALINKIKEILALNNIFLLGRFAEWEYYNMDKAIEAAFLLKKRLFA